MKRQKVAQRIDGGRVHLRSLAPLGAIVASACARLRLRLQGAAVDHHRRWLPLASGVLAQQNTQILNHGLEAAGIHPHSGA